MCGRVCHRAGAGRWIAIDRRQPVLPTFQEGAHGSHRWSAGTLTGKPAPKKPIELEDSLERDLEAEFGERLNPEYFIGYLTNKYEELYQLT